MGASVSWLSGLLWAKKEIRILILGLVRRIMPLLERNGGRCGLISMADSRTMLERQRFYTGCRYVAPRPPLWARADHGFTDRTSRHHNTDNRLQRRVRDIQKSKFQRLGEHQAPDALHRSSLTCSPGSRWTNLDTAVLEMLLRQHGSGDLRYRFDRHRPVGNGLGGTGSHAERGRAEGCGAVSVCE